MISFPWDSQVTKLGADGLPEYDRPSSAADMRALLGRFFSDGVFMREPDSLKVEPGTGMNVVVKPGGCIIRGTEATEDKDRTLALQAADPAQQRVDTVVVRWNSNLEERKMDLYVVKGTPGQGRPALTRTESVYELGIADITIPANTSSVTVQRITDTRMEPARCGMAVPFADLDTSELFDQLKAATDEAVKAYGDAIDGTLAGELQNDIKALQTEVQPIERGGTGATSAGAALDNLGAAAKSHTHTSSNITDLKSWLLANVYKVGYVWVSYTNTSPASIVGGSWTPITGRFPYFNASTAMGGSNTHALSVNEMPSHTHRPHVTNTADIGHGAYGLNPATGFQGNVTVLAYPQKSTIIDNTGGSAAHNNMPAYQSLYAWRRTA